MVILIDAKTEYATFRQVMSDLDSALERIEMLEDSGWQVSFKIFNEVSQNEFVSKLADQAMDELETIYPINQTVH